MWRPGGSANVNAPDDHSEVTAFSWNRKTGSGAMFNLKSGSRGTGLKQTDMLSPEFP